MVTGRPSVVEATRLVLAYYEEHPYRGAIHLILTFVTGGVWGFWFVGLWLVTFLGLNDTEKLRDLRKR